MFFEGREISPCAEPVSKDQLEEGQVYFSVNYVDDEMLVPVVKTLIFIGMNLEAGDIGQVYFQDVESYREGIRYAQDLGTGIAYFEKGPAEQIAHIFEFERALEALMRCSINRERKWLGGRMA